MPESLPGREQVRLERIRELYGRPGTPIYAATLIITFVAIEVTVVAWPVTGHAGALFWTGLMVVVQAGLAGLVWAFHQRPRTADQLPRWGRFRAWGEAGHGLCWSLAVPLVHAPGETVSLLAIMVTIVGLVAATAAGLAVHTASLIGFASLAMLPAAVFLVMRSAGWPELYAAGMLVSTYVLVLANAARMSLLYEESIQLRLSMGAQVDERRRLQVAAEHGRRLAEEATAERTRFFGAASHDLRQPVHALGLYASLLRRDPPARERRALIDGVVGCVESLDRLFGAILGVAQAARPEPGAPPAPAPLQDLIDRVFLQLKPAADRRGLTLSRTRTSLWVNVEPAAVERILANLMANAIRYTDAGRVVVGALRRGDRVELVVGDTGLGLSDADRKRIFEPFFQVRVPGRPRSEGFGLGLANVQQLCLTCGYEVDVASTLGLGTLFRVSLPAAAPSHELAAQPAAPVLAKGRHVLVLEDDVLVADAISRLLGAWDVTVHVARDGAEAMRLLEGAAQERWDVILDYRLDGDETGLDVADRIRAEHGSNIRLALLTGEADPAVFAAARRRDILVLQKPLKPIRLRAFLASSRVQTPA